MNKLILLILLSIFSPFLQAQTSLINNLKKHINYLADDKLEGRQTGSKGERMAYEYIIEQYNKIGLQPMGDLGSFLQTFPFSVKANPHDTLQPVATESGKKAHNVVAYLNRGAATTVVIGAHFDHLGYAEYGNSLYPGKEVQIHNGADDNASGTAAVLELADLLKNSNSKNNNYLFVNFSGEELGLFGSKYFVEHLPDIQLKYYDVANNNIHEIRNTKLEDEDIQNIIPAFENKLYYKLENITQDIFRDLQSGAINQDQILSKKIELTKIIQGELKTILDVNALRNIPNLKTDFRN